LRGFGDGVQGGWDDEVHPMDEEVVEEGVGCGSEWRVEGKMLGWRVCSMTVMVVVVVMMMMCTRY
jgi:hypothetical protein